MNKRYFLSFILLSVGALATVKAQKMTVLSNRNSLNFMGIAISPNGKYICGTDLETGMFVADWANQKVTYSPTSDMQLGAEMTSVSNDGVACGIDGPAVTFDINGVRTQLDTVYSVAEAISPDGQIVVGTSDYRDGIEHPRLWRNGEKFVLPEPRSEWAGYTVRGATPRRMNSDATVIVGYGIDTHRTYPTVVWHQDRDTTTYSVFPLSRHFFADATSTEAAPYSEFAVSGLSGNGKWIALQLTDAQTGASLFGRYDLEADTLQVVEFDNSTSLTDKLKYTAYSIADDGTMLAMTTNNPRVGIIWQAGEKSAKKLSEAFPTIPLLATYDKVGRNSPMDITPDGRYIVGFADPGGYEYETYVLDTQGESSNVTNVKTENGEGATAIYSPSGRRLSDPVKGLNLIRTANGQTRKIILK